MIPVCALYYLQLISVVRLNSETCYIKQWCHCFSQIYEHSTLIVFVIRAAGNNELLRSSDEHTTSLDVILLCVIHLLLHSRIVLCLDALERQLITIKIGFILPSEVVQGGSAYLIEIEVDHSLLNARDHCEVV